MIPDQGTHWAPGNPLQAAQVALGKAAGHLRAFHARERNYVADGHRALARIDETIGEAEITSFRLRLLTGGGCGAPDIWEGPDG
jgi:hypothetical protein